MKTHAKDFTQGEMHRIKVGQFKGKTVRIGSMFDDQVVTQVCIRGVWMDFVRMSVDELRQYV